MRRKLASNAATCFFWLRTRMKFDHLADNIAPASRTIASTYTKKKNSMIVLMEP